VLAAPHDAGTGPEPDADAIFQGIAEEELQSTRWDSGTTTITNESRLDLYRDYIKTSGGVYVGVGSIQNFTLAAWSKAEFVYLMDFTRIVVEANRIHLLFMEKSPDRAAYLSLWMKSSDARAARLIAESFSDQGAKKAKRYVQVYRIARDFFLTHLRQLRKVRARYAYQTYLESDELYGYVRDLVLKKRIKAVQGNLLAATTLRSIGDTVRKMQSRICVLYLSNAEEYRIFHPYPKPFRHNILNLPVDGESVVLRSLAVQKTSYAWAPGSELATHKGFHYSIQNLGDFQDWLKSPGYVSVLTIMKKSNPRERKSGVTYIENSAAKLL